MEWRRRTTVFQAGHIPSCCVMCGGVLPIADGCGWLLLLLSPLLSDAVGKRMPCRDQNVRVVGSYPSFEASHDWLVGHDARAARRYQPGWRNQRDLELTAAARPGHQDAGPRMIPGFPSSALPVFYGPGLVITGARTDVMSRPAQPLVCSPD